MKINRKKLLITFAIVLAGTLMGTALFGYMYFNQDGGGTGFGLNPGTNDQASLDKRVSVLLIGADKRPGENSFNADTLIVASVDPDTKLISMLSIPRDTRVTLGANNLVKINAVPMMRGIDDLKEQITDLTGIQLDGYMLTNFEGLKTIIDTLGGIDLYVEKDMYYETGDKEDGVINLKKGDQPLDGAKALQYARYRNDALADIGRTARQQKVLKAVANEMLQASTLTKLPKLIPQFMEIIETDINLLDFITLSKVAASFDSANIVSQTLPGAGLYLEGISFWEVNRQEAQTIAGNLLLGITTDKIVDSMVLDLLSPEIKSHLTVPGGPNDPNGKNSPGHENKFLEPEAVTVPESQNPTRSKASNNLSGSSEPGADQDNLSRENDPGEVNFSVEIDPPIPEQKDFTVEIAPVKKDPSIPSSAS